MGASIASAQCTSSTGLGICGDSGDISSQVGFTWTNDGNTYKPTTSNQAISNLTITFGNATSGSGDATNYNTTIQGNSLTIAGNGKSLQMGDGGNGTLKFDFGRGSDRTITLDLSSVASSDYALKGNLELWGHDDYNDVFTAVFGGKGISGNAILDGAGTASITLESGANIDGTLTIRDGQKTIIVRGDSTQTRFKQGIISEALGRTNTKILFDTPNSTGRHILKDTLTLNAGSVIYGFTDNAIGGKIFEVNTSLLTFNGGYLGFDGAKQVLLGSSGTDTLQINNGGLSFFIDSNITQPSSATPILKGNLVLTNAGASFSLKNAKSGINPFKDPNARSASGLSIYYVDGNVSIVNGKLSAFWDDSYGFTAKVNAENMLISGVLREGTNAWFEKGTFSNPHQIEKIEIKNTVGHIVFEDQMNIGGGINVRDGGGSTSQILFRDNATIGKSGQNYAIIAEQGGAQATLELYFEGSQNTIQGIFAKGGNAGWDAYKNIKVVFEGSSTTNTIDGDLMAQNWDGYSHYGSISIDFGGADNRINGKVMAYGGVNNLTFSGNGFISDNIEQKWNGRNNLTITNGATLTLNGSENTVHSLTGDNGIIEFSNSVTATRGVSKTFTANKTLTTSSLSGNLNAVVFASRERADQIIVNNQGSESTGTLTISAKGDINEILSITKKDGVIVAKVQDSTKVTVQGGESVIDGVVFDLGIEGDGSGNYLISNVANKGIDTSIQDIASSALTVNYDLYLANFNSLNKRMGELRDNPYSQGVWARIFGGATESSFGAGSKTDYVTFQAGYDYSLTFGNARNYMGVAFAYGKSWTKSNDGVGLTSSSLSNVNSNMVEVGIYNSYVEDSGWYNDTILKFDYIMSDFTLNAGNNIADKSANNFAMILSDEFGYRYKFGSDKSWYVDPQFEMAVGYFDQSDLNYTLNTSSNIAMSATQDSIFTLRTRFGASVGKKLVAGEGFATIYGGVFYEYDYIEGGNTQTQVSHINNNWKELESNGRMLLNIGTNVEVADGARLYLDVEKSFFGKVNVQYQVNVGARYSFGEKAPTTEWLEQQKKKGLPVSLRVNPEAQQQPVQQPVQQLPQQPAQPVSKQVKAQKAK